MKSKLHYLITLFFLMILFSLQTTAGTPKVVTGKVTLFSETGDKFILYVNNVRQNAEPAAIVEAKDVKSTSISFKIIFENTSIESLSKSISRPTSKDIIYAISKDPKGNYLIKVATKVMLPVTVATTVVTPTPDPTSTPTAKTDTVVLSKTTAVVTETKPSASPSITVKPTEATVTKPTSNVLINGHPAQTTLTTNSTGTPVYKAENNTGSITIDPSKAYHSPTINGVPAKDFPDALGNAFDQAFNGTTTTQPTTTATPPIVATTPEVTTVNTNTHPAAIGTATFFAEAGETVTVFFNGVQANAAPLSNVLVSNVSVIRFSVKVVFTDTTIAPITKTMMRMGKDCTYAIKKNKKGEYVVKVQTCTGQL